MTFIWSWLSINIFTDSLWMNMVMDISINMFTDSLKTLNMWIPPWQVKGSPRTNIDKEVIATTLEIIVFIAMIIDQHQYHHQHHSRNINKEVIATTYLLLEAVHKTFSSIILPLVCVVGGLAIGHSMQWSQFQMHQKCWIFGLGFCLSWSAFIMDNDHHID